MEMVEFYEVTKKYGRVEALRNASFKIPGKSVTALLGPNGAGKTTSMKLIMGFSKPTRGKVLVWGMEPWRREDLRIRLGYLPERPIYPLDAVVEDLLFHLAKLRGLGKSEVERVIKLTGLGDYRESKIGSLSRGYMQRLGIAQSLLGEPELLVLDEPTANLDPAARREVLELLKTLHKELNVSMIISSHIIPELQEIANYAVFIDRGVILDYGSLEDLWRKYRVEPLFIIETLDPGRVAKQLVEKPFVNAIRKLSPSKLEVLIDPENYKAFEKTVSELGELVLNYEFKSANLGDLYEKITRGRG